MINVTDIPQTKQHDPLHREWSAYYQAVQGRPPRETLLFALDRAAAAGKSPGFAVDLGCGDGRDTVEIVRRGWQVLAIDGAADAIEKLTQRPDIDQTKLSTAVQKFETIQLPENVDLLNASFCLQFCDPEHFPGFWQKIVDCLGLGGRFSGQLLGVRDSWTQYPNLNFHLRDRVEQELFIDFEFEFFEEEEHPGKTALGEAKYWHIFQIVARKKTA